MEHSLRAPIQTWKEGPVYVADCPSLRMASQGDSEQEAMDNLKEAIELYFEAPPEADSGTSGQPAPER